MIWMHARTSDRLRIPSVDGETEGFVKVFVKQGTNEILGATIVARPAGDMIRELTLAMIAGIGLRGIANTIPPDPTQAEAIQQVGDAYRRTHLTPPVAGRLRKWLSWMR